MLSDMSKMNSEPYAGFDQPLNHHDPYNMDSHVDGQDSNGGHPSGDNGDDEETADDGPQPRKRLKKDGTMKRKKVGHACLYCRRSHMTCDEGRPCQRCIKRDIGHMCHDDPKLAAAQRAAQQSALISPTDSIVTQPSAPLNAPTMDVPTTLPPVAMPQNEPMPFDGLQNQINPWALMTPGSSLFPNETLGSEFNVLSDFLDTLDDRSFFNTTPIPNLGPGLVAGPSPGQDNSNQYNFAPDMSSNFIPSVQAPPPPTNSNSMFGPDNPPNDQPPPIESVDPIPAPSKAERFLLTAADQESGTRDERLRRVIHAKYEAGLLKPYNYVTGYSRLTTWMNNHNVSADSRQQILQALSVFRPSFREIAQGLTDIDLVYVEEAFERLLLDYDRVFSAMGIPACLWRRTGEIYKGNKQFADLVGIPGEFLREGRLGIYELMAEPSSVNYWEKYSQIAFDTNKKAVLTTCVLRYKPALSTLSATANSRPNTTGGRKKKDRGKEEVKEERFINCCFSFTIRRDKWGIPCMVVGNFIRC